MICAKDEYENLKNNLPFILNQDYKDYEVVVVNDASEDETTDLLAELSMKHKHLKIVNIKQDLNFFKGKKFPLSIGIKSAKNDIILLTDADCRPSGNKWISRMQSLFKGNKSIVLGYGAYESRKGVLNKIIRYDTIHIAIQYLSFAMAGLPYMGVGRNLAYRKSLFYANSGFISHYRISSGDDDLFINKVANKKNTTISVHHESHSISSATTSFKKWLMQKKRHVSTARYYKFKHKFMLGCYVITQFFFFFSFILLMVLNQNIIWVLPLFILKLLSQLVLFKNCMNRLNEKNLLLISPLIEVFITILNPILTLSNLIFKRNKWK
ncbi:glycosyltransferase [Bacteroidota bacterium]